MTPDELDACRKPKLPYLAWHADAEQRIERGEEQVFCTLCERWQWEANLCDKARALRLPESEPQP